MVGVMDKEILSLKKIYSGIVPGFGVNHAKIYYALLSSEVKTAKQLIEETGVCQPITYSVLNNLIENQLISKNNVKPSGFFLNDPIKTYFKKTEKTRKQFEKGKKELENIILSDSEEKLQKFIIEIGKGNQTKLINSETKQEIKEAYELKAIKKEIEEIITRNQKPKYHTWKYG